MNRTRFFLPAIIIALVLLAAFLIAQKEQPAGNRFISYIADAKKQNVKFYWKDDKQVPFKSLQKLKIWLDNRHEQLVFAMNGGMYTPDHLPRGLFIDNTRTLAPLDTSAGTGNFYLKPNGVLYITDKNIAGICSTTRFHNDGSIKYATQSGPMMVIDGKIHAAFKKGSANLNIRNGAGILPGNKIIFAMSEKEISFYDFANYFKSLGCKNALYLDGLVSRAYLPEKGWIQTDGDFAVIIGVTNK